ncbi:hypothetical protein L1987_45688 [Smallanthus sonchifolius]|uniref:Uncharacterized protein n=1 Tax=Smallanthus sonchifolius TaxID=185202 RepID=A0ACB9FXJ1_9ASTR|nr:hypothetical protein L1987_45688 [Smallanthus sonchifolius]
MVWCSTLFMGKRGSKVMVVPSPMKEIVLPSVSSLLDSSTSGSSSNRMLSNTLKSTKHSPSSGPVSPGLGKEGLDLIVGYLPIQDNLWFSSSYTDLGGVR